MNIKFDPLADGVFERVDDITRHSALEIDDYSFGSDNLLERIAITVTGVAAAIPAIKNSKDKFGRIPRSAQDRIRALDDLFILATDKVQEAIEIAGGAGEISFGDHKIFIFALFGKRSVSFDEDNSATTVKDWLEPSSKRVGRGRLRGWGVGLIKNDSNARILALKAEDLGQDESSTRLIVSRLSLWRETLVTLWARSLINAHEQSEFQEER